MIVFNGSHFLTNQQLNMYVFPVWNRIQDILWL